MSSSPSSTMPKDLTPSCSSSVETLRGLPPELEVLTSAMSDSGSRPYTPPGAASGSSRPPSPHSSWPSPSSPSGDSVSSFPSVSSSFLFSSNPETPPHVDLELATHHTTHSPRESPHELVIPSLILPSPLKRSTPQGKTIGDVKLLVLSNSNQAAEEVLKVLADESCEDYVDVGRWEEVEFEWAHPQTPSLKKPKVLRVSTNWLEHRDAHGLEKYEGTKNMELVRLPNYSIDMNPAEVIRTALSVVHTPFHKLHSLLKADYPPNNLLASLLSSPTTPLYTVCILALPTPPLEYEAALIKELAPHIPVIVLPPFASALSSYASVRRIPHTSSIRPSSPHDLRTAILRSSGTLSTLRLEAAERFLRWREVERSVENALSRGGPEASGVEKALRDWKLHSDAADVAGARPLDIMRWDKARWEADWEGSLSSDVSKALRQRRGRRKIDRRLTVTAKTRPTLSAFPLTPFTTSSPSSLPLSEHSVSPDHHRRVPSGTEDTFTQGRKLNNPAISFDPLHFPSLIAFSCSLLAPLRSRLVSMFSVSGFTSSPYSEKGRAQGFNVHYVISAFCAGLGLGFVLAKFRI